jgi:hypothetical protein
MQRVKARFLSLKRVYCDLGWGGWPGGRSRSTQSPGNEATQENVSFKKGLSKEYLFLRGDPQNPPQGKEKVKEDT